MRISDWSSDVCSSDLDIGLRHIFRDWRRRRSAEATAKRAARPPVIRPPAAVETIEALKIARAGVGTVGREHEIVIAGLQRQLGSAEQQIGFDRLLGRIGVAGEIDAETVVLDPLLGITIAFAGRLIRRDAATSRKTPSDQNGK